MALKGIRLVCPLCVLLVRLDKNCTNKLCVCGVARRWSDVDDEGGGWLVGVRYLLIAVLFFSTVELL